MRVRDDGLAERTISFLPVDLLNHKPRLDVTTGHGAPADPCNQLIEQKAACGEFSSGQHASMETAKDDLNSACTPIGNNDVKSTSSLGRYSRNDAESARIR